MFTASHNPAQYNGIKLCRPGAAPVGEESGLRQIKEMVATGQLPPAAEVPGTLRQRDLLADYAAFLRSLVDLSGIRPLRVVVEQGGRPIARTEMLQASNGTFPALRIALD